MISIPTAEEFVKNHKARVNYSAFDYMREFAKLHVKAALEAATKGHICLRIYDSKGEFREESLGQEVTTDRESEYYGLHKDSIFDSYPEALVV